LVKIILSSTSNWRQSHPANAAGRAQPREATPPPGVDPLVASATVMPDRSRVLTTLLNELWLSHRNPPATVDRYAMYGIATAPVVTSRAAPHRADTLQPARILATSARRPRAAAAKPSASG